MVFMLGNKMKYRLNKKKKNNAVATTAAATLLTLATIVVVVVATIGAITIMGINQSAHAVWALGETAPALIGTSTG